MPESNALFIAGSVPSMASVITELGIVLLPGIEHATNIAGINNLKVMDTRIKNK